MIPETPGTGFTVVTSSSGIWTGMGDGSGGKSECVLYYMSSKRTASLTKSILIASRILPSYCVAYQTWRDIDHGTTPVIL